MRDDCSGRQPSAQEDGTTGGAAVLIFRCQQTSRISDWKRHQLTNKLTENIRTFVARLDRAVPRDFKEYVNVPASALRERDGAERCVVAHVVARHGLDAVRDHVVSVFELLILWMLLRQPGATTIPRKEERNVGTLFAVELREDSAFDVFHMRVSRKLHVDELSSIHGGAVQVLDHFQRLRQVRVELLLL